MLIKFPFCLNTKCKLSFRRAARMCDLCMTFVSSTHCPRRAVTSGHQKTRLDKSRDGKIPSRLYTHRLHLEVLEGWTASVSQFVHTNTIKTRGRFPLIENIHLRYLASICVCGTWLTLNARHISPVKFACSTAATHCILTCLHVCPWG